MLIRLMKTSEGLLPAYDSDKEIYDKLKLNEIHFFKTANMRSPEFHRKYFALIKLCFENQEQFGDMQDLRYYMQMKAGYYRIVPTDKGQMILPESIAFEKMDNETFKELYSKVLDIVCVMLNGKQEHIEAELINFM